MVALGADRWGPIVLCLLALVGLPTAGARAEGDEWQHPVIQAVKAEQAPVIDGVLGDACWQSAPMVEGFRYPPKKRPASEPTRVWMCYDSRAAYFAFYCYDSKPGEIGARETKRNSEDFWSDDWTGVNIDASGNHIACIRTRDRIVLTALDSTLSGGVPTKTLTNLTSFIACRESDNPASQGFGYLVIRP